MTRRKLNFQTLHRVLRNEAYAGWIRVNKWGEKKMGAFQPIVNQETFDKVQALLVARRRSLVSYRPIHPDFPLRRWVRCGLCNSPMTASWSTGRSKKKYAYYHCPSATCKRVVIPKVELENQFHALLSKLKPTPAYLKIFKETVLEHWKKRQTESMTSTVTWKQHLENLNQKKERLIGHLLDKTITKATFQEQEAKIDEEILLATIDLKESNLEELDVEAVLEFAGKLGLQIERVWNEASHNQKQRIQQLVFPSGLAYASGKFGTAPTGLMFKHLDKEKSGESPMAASHGFEP